MTKTKSGMRKIPINDKLESVLKRAIEAYVPNNENLLFTIIFVTDLFQISL